MKYAPMYFFKITISKCRVKNRDCYYRRENRGGLEQFYF